MYRGRYKLYIPDRAWCVQELVKIGIIGFLILYLFYDSFVWIFLVVPIGIVIWRNDDKRFIEKRKDRVISEFKDMISFLSGNLNVGYSLENSFVRTVSELSKLYENECLIDTELKTILRGMRYGERLEEMLLTFGERSEIAEIKECAGLIAVTKLYGGGMIRVIHQVSRNLDEQHIAKNEIDTTIAAKRLEGRVMLCMPFAIIMYMKITNAGYMDVLYATGYGRIIMTIAVLLILVSYGLIARITRIEV